jgi:hypothetical protein
VGEQENEVPSVWAPLEQANTARSQHRHIATSLVVIPSQIPDVDFDLIRICRHICNPNWICNSAPIRADLYRAVPRNVIIL